ncbi:MAG TPA: hypothetical protein PKD85_13095 [Saprospiraceae bacterium]|nr:hypothetical protein [Saprospiraceae bacterium]
MKLSLEALKGLAVEADVLAKITGGAKTKCHCYYESETKGEGCPKIPKPICS